MIWKVSVSMWARFVRAFLVALLTVPLYSFDLAAALADSEQQTKALIASLTDPSGKESVVLWNALGGIHQAQAKLSEAEQDYRQALALNRALGVPAKMQEATILNNLAT